MRGRVRFVPSRSRTDSEFRAMTRIAATGLRDLECPEVRILQGMSEDPIDSDRLPSGSTGGLAVPVG